MNERKKVLELFEQQKDYMNSRVAEGIEKYRKTTISVCVNDSHGNPVKDAKINIKQKRHAFKYGANIFMLDELESEEKNNKYKEIMSGFGNIATLPFYWDSTEPEKGKTRYSIDSEKIYRRPSIDLCMEFCNKHNIEPREHALAYAALFPKWVGEMSVEEEKRALENRYREIAERYADRIPTIEVTNEMEWVKTISKFYEQPDYIEWCFKTARKYFPKNQLVINEHTVLCWADRCRATDKYYSYIEANILKGAPIDAIGMQYHIFSRREDEYEKTRKYYSPIELYKHLDLYSDFGKPLQITEITVPSYSWNDEDEAIQAEIIENLYKIWFSHPNVEQIIYWNLIDGYAAFAPQGDMSAGENYFHGGLFRFDFTPKPAYYVIKNLFEKTWHTDESLVSNDSGKVECRGFYGDYEISVGDKKYDVTVSKDGNNTFSLEI